MRMGAKVGNCAFFKRNNSVFKSINPLIMSILRNELQTLLKDLEFELTQRKAEAEFLAEEDPTHIKIHEQMRVVVALQTALLSSMENPGIKTKVVHSLSKPAWNVVGVRLAGKFKIARVPYIVAEDNHVTEINRNEAREHADFISHCFNHSDLL